MQLENLRIEVNQKYSLDFMTHFPKKNALGNAIMFYSLHDITLLPNERKIVPLELKLAVDPNTVLQIDNNEEIARQNGIMTLSQYVTSQDRDFVSITLWNTTSVKFNIKKGDVIANGYILASPYQYDLQRVKKV